MHFCHYFWNTNAQTTTIYIIVFFKIGIIQNLFQKIYLISIHVKKFTVQSMGHANVKNLYFEV